MENPHILRRKLLAVLRAGIFGAGIFDGLIFALNIVCDKLEPGQLRDGLTLVGYFVAAPMLLINSALGLKSTALTDYLVQGLFGASLFTLVSAFRQFLFKNSNEK
jgi:hypothetical protein